jgi:hypothetical protein
MQIVLFFIVVLLISCVVVFGLVYFFYLSVNNEEKKWNNGVCRICKTKLHFVRLEKGYTRLFVCDNNHRLLIHRLSTGNKRKDKT